MKTHIYKKKAGRGGGGVEDIIVGYANICRYFWGMANKAG